MTKIDKILDELTTEEKTELLNILISKAISKLNFNPGPNPIYIKYIKKEV